MEVSDEEISNETLQAVSAYKADLDSKSAQMEEAIMATTKNITYIFAAFGFLGNFLIVLIVYWSRSRFHGSFRYVMIATSLLDNAFLAMKISRFLFQPIDTPTLVVFSLVSGVVYTCSLMSDLLALSLTAERFLALVFPIRFQTMSYTAKRNFWLVTICCCTLLSCTRMHYTLVNYYYAIPGVSGNPWFNAMQVTSDTVAPMVLTALTLAQVIGMVNVVFQRYRDRNKVQVLEGGAKNSEMRSTISLLFALLICCLLDQIGYVGYDISARLFAGRVLDQYVTFGQADAYDYAYRSYVVWATLSSHFEVISRCIGFYLYILFNRSFRRAMVKLFACGESNEQQSVFTLNSRAN